MAGRNSSGSSVVLNQDIHFKGEKTQVRTKSQKCVPVEKSAVTEPADIGAFVPLVLGAVPISSGTGEISPLVKSALGAIATAAMISVKQIPGQAGFSTSYMLNLLKVVNGAYAKNGKLSEEEFRKLLASILAGILEKAGPAYSSYKQVLKDAMQAETLSAFLKGVQPIICAFTGDPVNANTGNFVYEKTDLELRGRIPLSFSRFYNRIDTRSGVMGKGWRHNYEIELQEREDRYTVIWNDGREEVYLRKEDGTPEPLIPVPCRLECADNGFSYQTKDGIMYRFRRDGRLQSRKDPKGQGLRFAYDHKGRLSDVTNGKGSFLHYQYDTFTGMLAQVTDHTGRSVCLNYELGRLKEVKGPDGSSYRYEYHGDNSIRRIRNPRNVYVLQNTYDDRGRVTEQNFADGGKIRYDYQESLSRTFVVDQNEGRTAYVHDSRFRNVQTVYVDGEETFQYNDRDQLISRTDKNGNQTRYAYDNRGNTTQILYPDGSKHNMTYNAGNRLLTLSINGSMKLKNTYDEQGNIVSTEDALGRKRILEYDGQGNVSATVLPDGSRVSLEYDEKGNILSVTDGAGSQTRYAYDDCNRVIAVTDGNGNRSRFSYDVCDRITTVTNAEGKKCTYAYTKNGKVTRITDFNGAVTSQAYNEMNQVSKISLPDGGEIHLEYDRMQNVTRRTLPNGASIQYQYDLLGHMEQMTLPTGGTVRYGYDANGNRTSVTDSSGNRTVLEYDERDRITAVTDPEGARTAYEYDMEGNLTRVTNALGQSHTYEYDTAGQKIRETDITGNIISYQYNELGKISCVTDPLGRKTLYEYAGGGLLSAVSYPDGSRETFQYDKNRNLTRRENQKGEYLLFTYDCMDRVVKAASSFGQEKSYTYDGAGHVTSMTDALGHVTRYEYSAGGKLTAVTDAAGNKTEYAYDQMGNLITVCQHEGNKTLLSEDTLRNFAEEFNSVNRSKLRITRYERDLQGNVKTVINPLGQKEHYTYDEAGHLLSKKDREGYKTDYRYNSRGDLEEICYNDGRSVQYSYNALRQLTEIRDWLGVTKMELDEVGRVKRITDPQGRQIGYQWGQMGERKALMYPDGRKISYEYDELSRLSRLIDGDREILYSYSEEGKLEEKRFPDGITTSYGYNEMGLLASLTHRQGEKELEQYRYAYDQMGNKISIQKRRAAQWGTGGIPEEINQKLEAERGRYQYRYDEMNRLTEVVHGNETVSQYRYDAFGNRTWSKQGYEERSYEYNAANQLLKVMSDGRNENYQYDKRGNLTGIFRDKKLVNGYLYDETNRLSEAVNSRGQAVRYEYNGLGNRVGRKEYRLPEETERSLLPENPVRETEYLLDLTKPYHNLLEQRETTEGETASQTYTWDSNVVYATEGESAHIYLQDELGSPVRLIGIQKNGEEESRVPEIRQMVYGYDEFGNDLYGTQGEVQPFGYTGYQKDIVANTYFAQAREYMPQIGRFAGNDFVAGNILEPATLNRYWYCKYSPLNWVDLDGLKPQKEERDWDWWDFLFGNSQFLNKDNNKGNHLKDRVNIEGGRNYKSGKNELTKIRNNERKYFIEVFQEVDEVADYVGQRADAIFDGSVEGGAGIGGDLYMGPVTGLFEFKLSCLEVNEHGELEMKSEGKFGIKINGKEYAFEGGYNYTKEKFYNEFIADKFSFSDDIIWSYGGSVYAGIGGGYSIDINVSEIGNTLMDLGAKIFKCDNQN